VADDNISDVVEPENADWGGGTRTIPVARQSLPGCRTQDLIGDHFLGQDNLQFNDYANDSPE
jgi:hypothetical protein